MGNDWINIAGLNLPNGTFIPAGTYTVNDCDGVAAVLSLDNNILTIKDKGSVSRFDEITLLNTAPDIYNISINNFTGDITIDEYPSVRLVFVQNVLSSVIC